MDEPRPRSPIGHRTGLPRLGARDPLPGRVCRARLIASTWPEGDEPLLLVDAVGPWPVPASGFGVWSGDHVEIPWNADLVARRHGLTLTLIAFERRLWGRCRIPRGTAWQVSQSCLVGVVSGGSGSSRAAAGACFLAALTAGRAVVAEVAVRA